MLNWHNYTDQFYHGGSREKEHCTVMAFHTWKGIEVEELCFYFRLSLAYSKTFSMSDSSGAFTIDSTDFINFDSVCYVCNPVTKTCRQRQVRETYCL